MSDSIGLRVHERVATLVWRSWRTLGAPASAPTLQHTIVDPEALVVLTAWIARSGDDRMLGIAAEWCQRHHGLMPIVRLRRLVPADDPELRAAVTRLVSISNGFVAGPESPIAFDVRPTIDIHAADAVDMGSPANVRLRLRSLMGPSARAEALAVLLAHATASNRDLSSAALSRSTMFGQRHMRAALGDLAFGGWVDRWQLGARELRFAASERSVEVLGPCPDWIDWVARLPVLVAVLRAADALESRTLRALALAMSTLDQVESGIRACGLAPPDWRGADSVEGRLRVEAWLDDAAAVLTRAV